MAELKDFVELGMVGFTDKGNYEGGTTYMKNDLVHSNNKIWKCLQDSVTGQDPEEGEYWTVWIDTPNDLSNLNVTDTDGILSQGQPTEPPATVTAQELLDGIGAPAFEDSGEVEEISAFDKFLETVKSGMKFIDFFKNLKAGLKFVLHTGQLVNNGLCNEPGKYPLDAAYGKILLDMITENQSAISALNADCNFKRGDRYELSTNIQHVGVFSNTSAFVTIVLPKNIENVTPVLSCNSIALRGPSGNVITPTTYSSFEPKITVVRKSEFEITVKFDATKGQFKSDTALVVCSTEINGGVINFN